MFAIANEMKTTERNNQMLKIAHIHAIGLIISISSCKQLKLCKFYVYIACNNSKMGTVISVGIIFIEQKVSTLMEIIIVTMCKFFCHHNISARCPILLHAIRLLP